MKNGNSSRTAGLILLAAGAALTAAGLLQGQDASAKAFRICMECVGIG